MKCPLVFCADCGNLLENPIGEFVECAVCGRVADGKLFENNIIETVKEFSVKRTEKEKETEGARIDEKCPKCDAPTMVFHTAQLRSADEGQTIFYSCKECGHKFSVNS